MGINSTPNQLASDQVALLAVKDPISQSASTATTGWIAAKDYFNYLAVVKVGVLGASATVDAKLQQATDSSGTGAKDITGKAITQLTKASTDDNKQAMINLKPEELDIANSFTHFRLSITVATAACLVDAEVWGFNKRYDEAGSGDVATVDSVIS
jgi:hypothetical protein